MKILLKCFLWLVIFGLFALAGGAGYFEFAPAPSTCVKCHEIQKSKDNWLMSAHKNVDCKACHGTSVGSFHAIQENVNRVWRHMKFAKHDNMRLSEDQILRMTPLCGACHATEYSLWQKNGHSAAYEKFLADKKCNAAQKPADQCLRCHGMFYDGQFRDLMTRQGTNTLWTFCDAKMAKRPSIPCLACHAGHVEPAVATNGVFFYSRPDESWFAAANLSLPASVLKGKPVKQSLDPHSKLCVQCHAPLTSGEVGSGDDKTPTGVHEGISCTVCHNPHSGGTENSCLQCHPKFSRCKERDVRKLDTTYLSAKSGHDVHHLTCTSCHAEHPANPAK